MPKSIGPLVMTFILVLVSIWAYNYFSKGGVVMLGRNAKGGPGNETAA